MGKPSLHVIIASTRPDPVGRPVGKWFTEQALGHGAFDVEVVELAELGLPFMDEPKHPKLGDYVHDHTRRWSAKVDRADAFAFVMPEYNHGFSAPLKNAIDFLHREWQHKPVGFVSYGGVSGGTRAVQLIKPVVASLKMVPLFEAVAIPFVQQFLEDGELLANDPMNNSATAMLDELARWSAALERVRVRSRQPA